MPPSPLRVAIAGGGPAGLTLAAVLGKHQPNIIVDIYEAKKTISVTGNAIYIWKRPWQVLKDLGVEDDLVKRGISLPKDGEVIGPTFRKADQEGAGFDFHNHMMPYGPIGLRRAVLVEIIQARLSPNCTIHTSKRLENYRVQESGEVLLTFADGSISVADVLVGADGLHSATRSSMFPPEIARARFTGCLAYRCLIPPENLKAVDLNLEVITQPKIWCGKGKHVVSQPVGSTLFITFFVTDPAKAQVPFTEPWVMDATVEEVAAQFTEWDPDLQTLLKRISQPSRWAIHVVHISHSVSGPVALAGDAAHAMTPHQGVGGGQAIEDAYILGRLLSHPKVTVENMADVLAIYERVRLPRAQRAAERSFENGLMYEFSHPDFSFEGDPSREQLERLGRAIGETFQWLAEGGVDEDWQKCKEAMDALN